MHISNIDQILDALQSTGGMKIKNGFFNPDHQIHFAEMINVNVSKRICNPYQKIRTSNPLFSCFYGYVEDVSYDRRGNIETILEFA